ncbi:MAG TPA: hypothetical protein PKG92_10065, partial [Anaerolineaceae bacterium]|nr:hypothetical protein [Anaerolineaceae bacterium]HOE03146.1 hypothetical protein [Anaerolineaceae bacterium]
LTTFVKVQQFTENMLHQHRKNWFQLNCIKSNYFMFINHLNNPILTPATTIYSRLHGKKKKHNGCSKLERFNFLARS